MESISYLERKAVIDSTQQYRYLLTRRWAVGLELCFIMLNPSTADALVDDATIRKCVGFARRMGFGAIRIVNLYAFRATKPKDMLGRLDPIGPANDSYIAEAIHECKTIVCAWGNNASPLRAAEVMGMLIMSKRRGYALSINSNGSPGHPLMLSYDRNLKEFV